MKRALLIAFLLPMVAAAEPGTYLLTLTDVVEVQARGSVDGYRLHSGCDVAAQTVGTQLVADFGVGDTHELAGDSNNGPVVCVVPFNAIGDGEFDNVFALSADLPPGRVRALLDCQFRSDSGELIACSGSLQP